MNELRAHHVTETLSNNEAQRLRRCLVNEARISLAPSVPLDLRGKANIGERRRLRATFPTVAVAAAIAVIVTGLLVLNATFTPQAAQAMITVTPHGNWVDISPNITVENFDAEAAVTELRAHGFKAKRGTYNQWRDQNGELNIQAPKSAGLDLSSHGFQFADGQEVLFRVEGPVGAEFPVRPNSTTLDWDAAAEQFGFRNPAAQSDGLELRRDAPVTIWVLTAP